MPVALPSRRVTALDRLRWVVLTFAPSSLLLGVTTYLTTDIAAVPLLWVLSLSLYLLSFVIVFSRKPAIPHGMAVRAQPFFLLILVVLLFWGIADPVSVLYPLHLIVFFLAALVCRGALACLISTKLLDLAPVLGNLARSLGLVGVIQSDTELSEEGEESLNYVSTWALLAHRAEDLRGLDRDVRWGPLPDEPGAAVWSDDFSNILGTFKFGN